MHTLDKIIDFSVWTGAWPFHHLPYREIPPLKQKLQGLRVSRAFVAPLNAILEEDPQRADLELLKNIDDPFFSPAPVIDLSFANWRETLDRCTHDKRVRLIKLIPNYHNYHLHEDTIGQLIAALNGKNMIIGIQVRIEDTRGQHPLMLVHDVNAVLLAKVLSFFPEQKFILHNLYYSEIFQFHHFFQNVYFDLACLEYANVLKKLHGQYTLDRFLFSSHMPFYYPEGNINKLIYADVESELIEKVAYKNAEMLLRQTDRIAKTTTKTRAKG